MKNPAEKLTILYHFNLTFYPTAYATLHLVTLVVLPGAGEKDGTFYGLNYY